MKHKSLSPSDMMINITENDIAELFSKAESSMIIGQPRALQALQMGTEIQGKGYNIFVTGISGTGRISAIKKIFKNITGPKAPLNDIVYVYNFKDPDKPNVIYLPKGYGTKFKKEIHDLVENLKKSIQKILNKKIYSTTRDNLLSDLEKEENRLISDFEQKIRKYNFKIVRTMDADEDEATDIQPLWEGKPVSFDKLQEFVRDGIIEETLWNKLRKQYYEFMEEMRRIFIKINNKNMELDKKLHSLKIDMVTPEIERLFTSFDSSYKDKSVSRYLSDFKEDVLQNIVHFIPQEQEDSEAGSSDLLRYGVNVVVDHSRTEGVPIIFENHPRYTNLFGSIETKIDLNGESRTNFMMIKGGSIIQASGGFLVLKAEDLLKEESTWENLKKALQTEEVEIQNPSGAFNMQISSLKPAPIAINVKILMVGGENLYEILYNNDRDFQKFFKISAEFDSEMDLNNENLIHYMGFVKMIISEEHLLKPLPEGILEIIKYGIRLSEHKKKLSTRFSLIADLIRESSYWASKKGNNVIDKNAVKTALDKRKFFHNLPEEKLVEYINSGDIILNVEGSQTGRVNGLAIHDRGFYSYGSPLVISAQVSPGNEGIVNIDREVGLSGEIHDKGVLIIEGYIRTKYSKDFPLSIYASICFEQSYSEIDGDSASSTEIYALLSAISGLPIKQSIAVTGSVNQMGQIQPVGGITEKVTGFYNICKQMGFNGDQGVIIPAQNIVNLILPENICYSVQNGEFSIYPITTIDEGMEILTGMESGTRNRKGNFPPHTINYLVENKLKEIAHLVKNYSG